MNSYCNIFEFFFNSGLTVFPKALLIKDDRTLLTKMGHFTFYNTDRRYSRRMDFNKIRREIIIYINILINNFKVNDN